jgi:hypothetical protein
MRCSSAKALFNSLFYCFMLSSKALSLLESKAFRLFICLNISAGFGDKVLAGEDCDPNLTDPGVFPVPGDLISSETKLVSQSPNCSAFL